MDKLTVLVERDSEGGFNIATHTSCIATMSMAVKALTFLNPAAYLPVPLAAVQAPDDAGNTAAPPSDAEIAAAALRDRMEAQDDELPLRAFYPVSNDED